MMAEQSIVYLASYLAPLAAHLMRPDVTDIYINRPGELWTETVGGAIERHDAPDLTAPLLLRLARQIAALTAQAISREHPVLSGMLPTGERVQIVIPPATRGAIAIAIRKHVEASMRLEDYQSGGAFGAVRIGRASDGEPHSASDWTAIDDPMLLLRSAVKERRNILISGGTSTGKTTFLNALLAEIPLHERLILIEDTPELRLPHRNAVGLIATRGALSESLVSVEDLLIASLRMRPDRIILGEIRGSEVTTFLRAVNTGHPGSLSTVHADSPARAIDQLALLVLQTGMRLSWEDVVVYVRRSLDLIVQLKRGSEGRSIDEILIVR